MVVALDELIIFATHDNFPKRIFRAVEVLKVCKNMQKMIGRKKNIFYVEILNDRLTHLWIGSKMPKKNFPKFNYYILIEHLKTSGKSF